MISLKNTLKALTSKISALDTLLNDVPHYTLLWTNPNPTSSFSAQTISLDLSGYDQIEMKCLMHTSSNGKNMQFFKGMVGERMAMTGQTLGHYALTRECNVNTKSIVFSYGTGGGSQNDGAVIPQKIYGIKFGGGITSRLCSALGGLYAKLKGYLKGDCGEHLNNQDRTGRKSTEVYGVWNSCDSDYKLVYDTERWVYSQPFGVDIGWQSSICDSPKLRRNKQNRVSHMQSSKKPWSNGYKHSRIFGTKGVHKQSIFDRRQVCEVLSLCLMPKEVAL